MTTKSTTKVLTIKEAVAIAFKAIGKNEISVNELAEYLKSSIADYADSDLEVLKKQANSFLASDVKKKVATYTKAVNPKTKKKRKGVYCLVKKREPKPIIKIDPPILDLFPIESEKYTKKKGGKKSGNEVIPVSPIPIPDSPVSTLYFGKGGEFAVASELLFRGYNASIMSVDEGIDITASKNNKFFFIQVKSTLLKDGRFNVTVKPNNFVNNSNVDVFYIIVLRYKHNDVHTNRYLVLPWRDILRFASTGLLSKTTSGLNIKVKQEAGCLLLYNGNKSDDVNYYLDHFNLIQ